MAQVKIKQRNIRILPLLAFGAAAIALITLSAVSFVSTRDQAHSAVRINLAGRQRMLSQKIVKEVLIFRLQGRNRASIDGAISVFDATLHALLDGGRAPADLEGTHYWTVPAAAPGPTRVALEEVHRLWEPFKELVARYENTGGESELRVTIRSSAELLSRIEDSVVALQHRAERDNLTARISTGALILLILASVTAYLVATVRRLRKATETIRKLETILPVCSNCKMIRSKEDPYDQDSWIPLEEYLYEKDGTEITHGLCPQCARTLYPDLYEKVLQRKKARESN